jgi:mercuric ion transport protein
MSEEISKKRTGERLLAAGAVFGAIAASSCCVLPLLFVSVGIGGAWIGRLAGLAPYQPFFLAFAAGCIAAGLWSVYGRRQAACSGHECSALASQRVTKAALWAGGVIVIVAASADWWAKFLS